MSGLRNVAASTLYLLASLPLGVAYFAIVVGGAAAGLSLLVFVVGFVVLASLTAVSRQIAAADAAIGAYLFDTPVPDFSPPSSSGGLLDSAVAELTTLSGYRAAVYLLVRFVVGVAGFTFVVTWLAFAAALLGTLLYYDNPEFTVGVVDVWEVETLPVAFAVAGAGAVVAVLGAVVVAPAGRVAARGATYVLELPRPDAD